MARCESRQTCITVFEDSDLKYIWRLLLEDSPPTVSTSSISNRQQWNIYLVRKAGSGWVFLLFLSGDLCSSWRREMNSSPVATTNRWPWLTHSPLRLTRMNDMWLWRDSHLQTGSSGLIGPGLCVGAGESSEDPLWSSQYLNSAGLAVLLW